MDFHQFLSEGMNDRITELIWSLVVVVKNLSADEGDATDAGLVLGSGRFPWRRKWQPTPVFLPGKSHGQGSLVGYSLWGHKRVHGEGHSPATKQKQQNRSLPLS